MDEQAKAASVKGVYSMLTQATLGFGATKKRVEQTVYFFVDDASDGSATIQPLNPSFVPSGDPGPIDKEELLQNYQPEPEIYRTKVLPAMRELEGAADRADELRKRGLLFSAEFEYKNALKIDEDHIRSTFGLGLSYLAGGETEEADQVFRRLSKLKGAFESRHKHLFNEFGIMLRRNHMYVQALKHYSRALHLSRDDEHIMYNIARVYCELKKFKPARKFLERALGVNPDFEKAQKLLDHLQTIC